MDFSNFQNFYLINFFICKAIFENRKKIRLDKYFGILSWKCAPVGKIKSFTVTSGLRISKFRIFYFISFKKDKFHWTHCSNSTLLVLGLHKIFFFIRNAKFFRLVPFLNFFRIWTSTVQYLSTNFFSKILMISFL